ncbi:hypothetical protein BDL97_14G083200 [Sphagnum fallax]|nr:hypothetical protein BDL97_14G083200 [Sphagnum fallax]
MTLSLTNASKLDDIVCTIKLTLHHPDPQQLHFPYLAWACNWCFIPSNIPGWFLRSLARPCLLSWWS